LHERDRRTDLDSMRPREPRQPNRVRTRYLRDLKRERPRDSESERPREK